MKCVGFNEVPGNFFFFFISVRIPARPDLASLRAASFMQRRNCHERFFQSTKTRSKETFLNKHTSREALEGRGAETDRVPNTN
jgi:hypothetical protein